MLSYLIFSIILLKKFIHHWTIISDKVINISHGINQAFFIKSTTSHDIFNHNQKMLVTLISISTSLNFNIQILVFHITFDQKSYCATSH